MPDPAVSFEFFPPGDEAMAQQLWQSVQRLAPLRPSFVSVTYGADGSTRTRTHEFVQRVLSETDLRVAPHLTCVGASCDEVLQIAQTYWQLGVRHLVALRGDAPAANLSADGRSQPDLPMPPIWYVACAKRGILKSRWRRIRKVIPNPAPSKPIWRI
jgi:methylenetetrahydrofolate reductase (NADPH)